MTDQERRNRQCRYVALMSGVVVTAVTATLTSCYWSYQEAHPEEDIFYNVLQHVKDVAWDVVTDVTKLGQLIGVVSSCYLWGSYYFVKAHEQEEPMRRADDMVPFEVGYRGDD